MRKDSTNTVPVVEIIITAEIDNVYFLRNHQYEYVRTYEDVADTRFDCPYLREDYHVVLRDCFQYSVPNSICVLTTVEKTEFEQDMVTYVEVTRRDNIKDRLDAYIKYLPIATTKENFGKPIYTGEAYKEELLREKGDV